MVARKKRRARSSRIDSMSLPQIKQKLPFIYQLALERIKGRWPEKVGCGPSDADGSNPEDRRRSDG